MTLSEHDRPDVEGTMGRAVGEDYDTADVLLIGRETYDSFAGGWPGREAAAGDDAPFAKHLGDVPGLPGTAAGSGVPDPEMHAVTAPAPASRT